MAWFHEARVGAWKYIRGLSLKEVPERIFLVTGQITTPKCWISHRGRDEICSIHFQNLIHRLPLPGTKNPWIGYDLFPVIPGVGFREVEQSGGPLSIFLTTYVAHELQLHPGSSKALAISQNIFSDKGSLGLSEIDRPETISLLEPSVDVVFVHGLGGSSRGTWTHPSTKFFWPADLFHREGFESARILTFGYSVDLGVLLGPASNRLGIEDIAGQLLDKISVHQKVTGPVHAY